MSNENMKAAEVALRLAFETIRAMGIKTKLDDGRTITEDDILLEEPTPEPEAEPEPEGFGLYYLDDGAEKIPIVTDRPDCIHNDMSCQDHGGMNWDAWCHVLDKGEVKRVKNAQDLPSDLTHIYPFAGGSDDIGMMSCHQWVEEMDENGIIVLEE
jgi:hypothetical protein